jgi:hypothetical protein
MKKSVIVTLAPKAIPRGMTNMLATAGGRKVRHERAERIKGRFEGMRPLVSSSTAELAPTENPPECSRPRAIKAVTGGQMASIFPGRVEAAAACLTAIQTSLHARG